MDMGRGRLREREGDGDSWRNRDIEIKECTEEFKIHCIKSFRIFLSPARMSLAGNNLFIPGQREFSQWHPGWGREKSKTFFYSVGIFVLIYLCNESPCINRQCRPNFQLGFRFRAFFSVHHALPITAERFAALVNARHTTENNNLDLVAAFIVKKIAFYFILLGGDGNTLN
jgi:hypothetical protein